MPARSIPRAADAAFVLIALAAFLSLLWLGSGLTFVRDEWAFIGRFDDWSLETLLRGHNGHFVPLQRIVWNVLGATVGLRSYMPYLALDLVAVVAAAAAVYVHGRRVTHWSIAIAAATIVLLLGSGAENLFMAVQMSWSAAMAAGAWALVVLLHDRRGRRRWVAALLLVLGLLMAGSFVLPFVLAILAIVVVSPRLRGAWWVVVPAAAIFVVWWLTVDTGGGTRLAPIGPARSFVEAGLANASGQVLAIGAGLGLVVVLLLGLAALGDAALARRPRLLLVAAMTALVGMWLLIALARAVSHPDTFAAPRYVHVSGILLALAIVGWAGQRRIRRPAQPARLVIVVALVAAIPLAWNVQQLRTFATIWQERSMAYRSAIAVLLEHGGTPALPADRGLVRDADRVLVLGEAGRPSLVPAPAALVGLVARYGSPVDDPLAPRGAPPSAADLDRALARLAPLRIGPAVTAGAAQPIGEPMVRDAVGAPTDGCLAVRPAGPDPTVELRVSGGGGVTVRSDADGVAWATLSLGEVFAAPAVAVELIGGQRSLVSAPDLGPTTELGLRLALTGEGTTTICRVGPGDGAP